MLHRRHLLLSAAASALPAGALAQTASAGKPLLEKTARILVGFPPGGSADLIARALALHMADYAPQVIVENKAGAGGRLALDTLKGAEADGSTLIVTPSSMLTLYPHVYTRLNYQVQRDFVPVAALASFAFVLVVGPLVPASVKTVAEFLAWCKANPRDASYASPGAGSTPHFVGAALARTSRTEMLHVAYKGGAPAMTDLMGGQVACNMAVISNAMPLLQSGKVRALAVTSAQRASALPQVPTLAEAGYAEAQASEWFAALLPSAAPAAAVVRLHQVLQAAMGTPALKALLAKAAFDTMTPHSPAQVAQLIQTDQAHWSRLVKATGYTPQDGE